MNPALKNRLKRTGILCAVALMFGGAIGWMQMRSQNAQIIRQTSAPEQPVAGIKIGGPFTLVDQNGKTVTEKIFEGKFALVYFGFTSCPAICPTELAKISKALKALGPAADNIRPVFITVDPGRDKPEAMKQYLSLFDARITGLTGSQAEIDEVLKNYRIYAAKRQEPGATDYTMDHSGFIYFINPKGDLLSIFRMTDTADSISTEMRNKMAVELLR